MAARHLIISLCQYNSVSVLEGRGSFERSGGVSWLEFIPALQALSGAMASIRSDISQVTSWLARSAGAQRRTGSEGLRQCQGQ